MFFLKGLFFNLTFYRFWYISSQGPRGTFRMFQGPFLGVLGSFWTQKPGPHPLILPHKWQKCKTCKIKAVKPVKRFTRFGFTGFYNFTFLRSRWQDEVWGMVPGCLGVVWTSFWPLLTPLKPYFEKSKISNRVKSEVKKKDLLKKNTFIRSFFLHQFYVKHIFWYNGFFFWKN